MYVAGGKAGMDMFYPFLSVCVRRRRCVIIKSCSNKRIPELLWEQEEQIAPEKYLIWYA